MQGQRPGMEWGPQSFRWRPIRCEQCARRYPGRAAPAVAQGAPNSTLIDVRDAPARLTVPRFEVDESGTLQLLPRSEELMQYAKVKRVLGSLRSVQRDAPRMSAEKVRSFIVRNRPDLPPKRVDELVEERMAGMRTTESERRVSFDEVKVVDGHVKLVCRDCGIRPRISRKRLALVIEQAVRGGQDVYVSPRGRVVVGRSWV